MKSSASYFGVSALLVALCASLTLSTAQANIGPAAYDDTRSGYACTNDPKGSLTVRNGPGRNYRAVGMLKSGTGVLVMNAVTGSDNMVWYNVKSGRITGWARNDYVCLPNG